MRNPFSFFVELMHQPCWIVLWVYYLVIVNVSSALFWNQPLAKAIFVTFIISAATIIGIYAIFGFEKIMGLGHIFWLPLLVFLLPQVADSQGWYRIYLVILALSIIISLAFDTVDVWKYLSRGKRNAQQPQTAERPF